MEHTLLPTPEYSKETLDAAVQMTPTLEVVLDTRPFASSTQDLFVLHKTTRRDMYNLSRERTGCEWHGQGPFDVILWNSDGEITETSITNIAIRFIIDGQPIWKTPKISCGVLPGVFRDFLLKSHPDLVEDIITIEDLKTAQKVYMSITWGKVRSTKFYCYSIGRISNCLFQFGKKSIPSSIIDSMRQGYTSFFRSSLLRP